MFVWKFIDINGVYIGTGLAYDQDHMARQISELIAGLPDPHIICTYMHNGARLIIERST